MTSRLIQEYNIEDSTLTQLGIAGPRILSIQIADSSYNVLDDLAANTGSSGTGTYIVINGSGFDTGSVVILSSSNLDTIGYQQANSTTYVSSTQLRALLPPKPAGFYNVYVQNGDGRNAVRINGIQYSDFPVWPNFGSLILRPKLLNYPFSYNFSTSPSSNTLIYSVANGSTIPANTTLLANGYYYGIPNTAGSSTNMYIDVKDAENQNTAQYFIDDVSSGDSAYYRTTMHLVSSENTKFNGDISANNHSFKCFGDIHPAAFHPFGNNWSYFFDGTTDYMTVPDSDFLNFLNLDFSVECWYLTAVTPGAGTTEILSKRATSSTFAGFRLGFTASLAPQFQATVDGVSFGVSITSSINIRLGQWNHLACTRVGNTWTLYVNGAVGGTATLAGTIPRNTATFGIGVSGTTGVIGASFISDVRVQFRNSAYNGAFIPPTSKLQKTADTALLTLQDNYIVDRSVNNFTITKVNDVAARPYGPYGDNTSYTETARLGSTYFDGTGDYMLADPGNNPDFDLPGDFTWECWFYYTGTYAAASVVYDTDALGDATGTGRFRVLVSSTTGAVLFTTLAAGTIITGAPMPRNVWTHILISRSGTSVKMFMNGLQTGATATSAVSFLTKPNRPSIGADGQVAGNIPMVGYMHGLRVLKNTALWTANTTPPTAPANVLPNTSLLMMQTYDGENNKRFCDVSKTGALVTYPVAQNGGVGSFSPFSPYGYSGYFDGTATNIDYITVAANTNLYLSNYDHCIEWWMFPDTTQQAFAIPWSYSGLASSNPGTDRYYCVFSGLPSVQLSFAGGSISVNAATFNLPYLNKWSHWCVTRTGNTFRIFVDGKLAGHTNNTITFANQASPLSIGATTSANEQWKGWISNFRVTINSVPTLYQTTQTTSNTQVFTPPTSALTLEANTKLLLLADNRFMDKSNNNFTVTRNGDNTKIIPFGPFRGTNAYQPHLHGASWLAQDAGNYFTVPYSKELFDWWNTGSGVVVPYTIELWFYCVTLPLTTTVPHIIGCQAIATTTTYWSFGLRSTGAVVFQYNNGTSQYVISSKTVKAMEWNHLAVTITSSGIRVWVNGVADPVVAISGTPTATVATTPLSIGAYNNATMFGYYSNLRIVKGDAIYTANTTPPTAPVTRTANTVLLMNFDTGGIVDYTTRHNLQTLGDYKTWPAPSRLGGTYSAYRNRYSNAAVFVDGTGDYATMAAARSETENFGTGDWCIEFWVYKYGSANQTIYDQRSATTQNSPLIYLTTTNNVRYYLNGFDRISTAAIASNTWVHIAVERYVGNVSIYVDGLRSGAIWLDSNVHTVNAHSFASASGGAQPHTGYIQDFRITRGARYTANLTNEMYQSYPIGY